MSDETLMDKLCLNSANVAEVMVGNQWIKCRRLDVEKYEDFFLLEMPGNQTIGDVLVKSEEIQAFRLKPDAGSTRP